MQLKYEAKDFKDLLDNVDLQFIVLNTDEIKIKVSNWLIVRRWDNHVENDILRRCGCFDNTKEKAEYIFKESDFTSRKEYFEEFILMVLKHEDTLHELKD